MVLLSLKQSLADSQEHYQIYVDACHTTPPKIKVGDLMFVLAKFIRTTRPSRKLSKYYLGPFEVTDKPSMYSYQVKLPHYLHAIHPVFHISQLELANLS